MLGNLYITASPIGNLEEVSPRVLRVFSEVDCIAAEDTRNTALLLNRLGISAKLTSYHKFNETAKLEVILDRLRSGQNIALVSDAGTPCISDPGHILVKAAAAENIPIIGLSGSCALTIALSVSGFPAEPFLFIGFLPRKASAIIEALSLQVECATLVFYESPKRICATVELLAKQFPESELCLCNDLTKKFERIYRGSPQKVLEELLANPHAEKGEYTCVSYRPLFAQDSVEGKLPSLESQLIDIMVNSSCSIKEAINVLSAKLKNTAKKEIYAASLRLKELLK